MHASPGRRGTAGRSLLRVGVAALLAFVLLLVIVAGGLVRALLSRSGPEVRDHPFFGRAAQGIEVVAHRGGMAEGPENTLEAFRRALAAGTDVLEMDLRASSDGELFAIHDVSVDRTTDGSGRVDALSSAQLRALDAAYHFSQDGETTPLRGRGVGIPSFAEVLDAFPETRLLAEIKPDASRSLAAETCRVIRAAGAGPRSLIVSFDESEIHGFRRACPEVATGASPPEGFRFFFWGVLRDEPTPPDALVVPSHLGRLRVATRGLVAAAQRRGMRVQSWLANDWQQVAAMRDAGLDGLLTDHPARVRRWLRERGLQ